MVLGEEAEAPRENVACPGKSRAGVDTQPRRTPWPVPQKAAIVLASQALVKAHQTKCSHGAACKHLRVRVRTKWEKLPLALKESN